MPPVKKRLACEDSPDYDKPCPLPGDTGGNSHDRRVAESDVMKLFRSCNATN